MRKYKTSFQATKKYRNFVSELTALCKKHDVHLCASGYEFLQVWNLDLKDRPLTARIENRTGEEWRETN